MLPSSLLFRVNEQMLPVNIVENNFNLYLHDLAALLDNTLDSTNIVLSM